MLIDFAVPSIGEYTHKILVEGQRVCQQEFEAGESVPCMLPPLTSKAYNEHLCHLVEVAMECLSENMRSASNLLHELSGVSYDEIIDVSNNPNS